MVTVTQVTELIAQLGGLAILAATLAAIGAFVYRWYVRERIPSGLGLLLGLSGVAIYLNTTAALGQVIGGSGAPTETEVALFNITAFLVGAGGATLGQWVGDRAGAELFLGDGFAEVEEDVGRLVQSVGRVVAVSLPQDIDDVVGYDPVPAETKETLAGKTFLFPRRVTVSELRERLVARLKADYGVGHVDIELADDGSVEYLALGSRAAGIGPTLPPATNAVAIRADPAFAASAGDLVQVWETDPMRRVLTAELRGVAGDTVTIAIDAADTQKLDPRQEYRLVTLPVEDRPDREFASLLRAADETFSSVTVEAGSPLHGLPIGALDVSVVAVKPEEKTPIALPDPDTLLAPGDVVFAIARPDALRRLEVAGEPLDPGLVREPSPPTRSPGATASGPTTETPETSETQETLETTTPSQPAADSQHSAGTDDESSTASTGASDAGESQTAESPDTSTTATDESTDSEPVADDASPTAEADGTVDADVNADETADFDPPAASGSGPDDTEDTDDAGKADSSSFQQLKAEFESGDADWAEGDSANGEESATADAASETDDSEAAFGDDGGDDPDDGGLDSALGAAGDDLGGLDIDEDKGEAESEDVDSDEGDDGLSDLGVESDDAFATDDTTGDDGDTDDGLDFDDGDDDLDSLGFGDDDEDDDLSSLSFDEDDDDGLSFDDDDEDNEADEEGDEEDGDEDDDDDDDDGDSGGGGASSFQQLKEEFESGDADWEDDISDSPGGDMRLDE